MKMKFSKVKYMIFTLKIGQKKIPCVNAILERKNFTWV